MTPDEATLAWMRGRADGALVALRTTGDRIATWLVVGNALALLTVLKAASDKQCSPALLSSAGKLFLVGLCFAFLGWIIGFALSAFAIILTDKTIGHASVVVGNEWRIERLQEKYPQHYQEGPLEQSVEDAGQQIRQLGSRIRYLWIGGVLAATFYVLSMASFVNGAAKPLSPDAMQACQAVTSKESKSTRSPASAHEP